MTNQIATLNQNLLHTIGQLKNDIEKQNKLIFKNAKINTPYQNVFAEIQVRLAAHKYTVEHPSRWHIIREDTEKSINNELEKIKQLMRNFNEAATKIHEISQGISQGIPAYENMTYDNSQLSNEISALKVTIKNLDDSLLSAPQEIAVKIISFFGAVVGVLGGAIAGWIAGTFIGAVLGCVFTGPAMEITGLVGGFWGSLAGGIYGACKGLELSEKAAKYGIYKYDTVKGNLHKFAEATTKELARYEAIQLVHNLQTKLLNNNNNTQLEQESIAHLVNKLT